MVHGEEKLQMNVKKIAVLTILVACGVIWFLLYSRINGQASTPEVESYSVGEWVPMEEDMLVSGEQMEGYEVQVVNYDLMDLEEYQKKYQVEFTEKEKKEFELPEKIYDVTVKVRNTSDRLEEEMGMNFFFLVLQGKELYGDTNDALYERVNPEAQGTMQFALRPGTEMEFHVPFNLRKEWFRKKQWEKVEDYPFYIVFTKYPVKKVVELKKK